MTDEGPAKEIVELTLKNYLRIKAARIRPDGRRVIKVCGRNAQGKSSVLGGIEMILRGAVAIPSEPIHRGEKRAEGVIDLGDLVATRVITPSGHVLTVTNKEGLKYPTPQAILDALRGKVAINITEFLTADAGRRMELLEQATHTDVRAIERERQEAYDRRRDLNRRAKALEGVVAALAKQVPEDLPAAPISAGDVLKRLRQVEEDNRGIERRRAARETAVADLRATEDGIADLERRLAELRGERGTIQQAIDTWEPLPEPADTADLARQIEKAETVNAALHKRSDLEERKAEMQRLRTEAAAETKRIAEADGARARAIADAHLPLEGLDVVDGEIAYHGLPYEQASTAERARIITALLMAASPDLHVLIIPSANILDSESQAAILQMAEERKYQVWMEITEDEYDPSDPAAVYIEDGEIVEGETTAG